jgi:hypothetical protein
MKKPASEAPVPVGVTKLAAAGTPESLEGLALEEAEGAKLKEGTGMEALGVGIGVTDVGAEVGLTGRGRAVGGREGTDCGGAMVKRSGGGATG